MQKIPSFREHPSYEYSFVNDFESNKENKEPPVTYSLPPRDSESSEGYPF